MIAPRVPSLFSSPRRRVAPCSVAPARGPEPLESRAMMATLSVVAPNAPVNGSTFRSLQEALAVASDGDTIRITPLAVIEDSSVSTKLTAAAAINDTTITTKIPVPFGQVIKLDNGVNSEEFAVVGITSVTGGQYQLTLSDKLTKAYAVNDTVDTTGDIAITKKVTLTSAIGMLPGSISIPSGLQVLADDVVFRNLRIGTGVNLMPGADGTAFRNCVLDDVSDTTGGKSGGRTFVDNVFFGDLVLRGDGDKTTIDRVNFNQFQNTSVRLIDGNSGTIVRNNVFSMNGDGTAISVDGGAGVLLRQNEITFATPTGIGTTAPSGGSIGIYVEGGGALNPVSLDIQNNRLDTGGLGIGILLDIAALGGTDFSAKVQGNEFFWNTIGVLVNGDTTAAATALGTVDLGGGTLGSHGGNNFRSFTVPGATANTSFSVYLANAAAATAATVFAQNNLWKTTTPGLTVKDSVNVSAAGSWPWGPGCGTVNVGGSQLSGNQQFVQALFNDFLGRSGSSTEINAWASTIGVTTTRQQVATSIIKSQEASTLYVTDLYHQILQRTPDTAGLNYWVSQLTAGASKESVASNLTASNEYFNKLSLLSLEVFPLPLNQSGATGDSAYVTSLYVRDLERLPENGELGGWLAPGPMNSSRRLAVAQTFLTQTEFRNLMIRSDLYYRLLNRQTPVPAAEVSSWNSSGLLLTPLQIAFASSNEYFLNG